MNPIRIILYSNYSKMQNLDKILRLCLTLYKQLHLWSWPQLEHGASHDITYTLLKWSAAQIFLRKLFVNIFWGKRVCLNHVCGMTKYIVNTTRIYEKWHNYEPYEIHQVEVGEQRTQGLHQSFPLPSSSFLCKARQGQEILQQCLEFCVLL